MRRPSLPSLIVLAITLGIGSGALEVGLRSSPQRGMGPGAIAAWLGVSIGMATGYLLLAALAGWMLKRNAYGLLIGALVLVHGALWYRFDVVLNLYASDPKVWGGLLGIIALAAVVTVVLDEALERLRVLVALVALIVGALGTTLAVSRAEAPSGEARGARKNVLVITVDTLRAGRIAPYGADNDTPAMSKLAQNGVVFETVVAAAPVTEPSHLAIFTGQPPFQSGVAANGTKLGDRPELAWHAFQDAGYTTAGFVAGFPLHSRFGWAQGMDVYDDDFGRFQGLHSLSLVKAFDQLFLPGNTLRERRGDLVLERSRSWLRDHHDEAFFMWVHFFDPHAPYEAPDHPFDPPTDGEPLDLPAYWPPRHSEITSTDWLEEAYDAEIRYTDGLIGQLVADLRSHNVLDDTIIVVTADHGESLTEHHYMFDHGDYLYDTELLIPMIVRAPGLARQGHRVPCQVSNADVAPTILALTELDQSAQQRALERTGRDLSGMLSGGACTDQPIVSSTVSVRFVDDPPVDHSYREPERKLIRKGEGSVEQCFDLVGDPGETSGVPCDLSMANSLDEVLAGGTAVVAPQQDSTTNAALEALGYIDGED